MFKPDPKPDQPATMPGMWSAGFDADNAGAWI
jgi:hypothetical protein